MRLFYAVVTACAVGVVVAAVDGGLLGVKDLSASILALLGTFSGAMFAFRLNQDKEDRKIQASRREALNRALFILIRQANAIHQLKLSFDEYKSEADRAFNLPANKPPGYAELKHNLTDLEFLIEAGYAELLFKVMLEQDRFHQTIRGVEERNDFYVKEFQVKLAEAGLNGRQTTNDEARTLLGERIFGTVMNTTAGAYAHLIAGDKSLLERVDELRTVARQLFPGVKFLSFKYSP